MAERFDENSLRREVLVPGSHTEFTMEKCTLKAGSRWEPERFPLSDRMQMFFFLNETGYAATQNQAWMIRQYSLFTPNYDKEAFWIEAGKQDLSFIRFTGVMNAYDQKEYIDYHIIVPCLREKAGAFAFTEYYTGGMGSTLVSRRLVLDTAFGRWFVGLVDGDGEDAFIGEHSLEHLHQWYYLLPGTEICYTVDGAEYAGHTGDAFHVPKGAAFSARPVNGGGLHALWIKFASEGFPVGRDGYPGSEE